MPGIAAKPSTKDVKQLPSGRSTPEPGQIKAERKADKPDRPRVDEGKLTAAVDALREAKAKANSTNGLFPNLPCHALYSSTILKRTAQSQCTDANGRATKLSLLSNFACQNTQS